MVKLLGFIALLLLVSSVAGQCTGCYLGTSGPCQQINTVCYDFQTPGVCPPGTSPCSGSTTTAPTTTAAPVTTEPITTTAPITTTTPITPTTTAPITTTTPTTTSPTTCGNCITKQELININSQSSWWGNCDTSQPSKANPGGATSDDGYYCSDAYVVKLNEMLCSLNYCSDIDAKRTFIGQVTHETAYITKFYVPADGGRGALHILPANIQLNVQHIQDLWPESNALDDYTAQGASILTTPTYAWLSAAAWFLKTNQVIVNCSKNLFLETFAETSRCVFGNTDDPGLGSRQQAYDYAVQYLNINNSPTTTSPPMTTQPPVNTKPSKKCNCITKQELININSQSGWWGNCDTTQDPKASPGGATGSDGYYCSDAFVAKLNEMLCSLELCYNLPAKRAFIGQIVYETAYFTKFYQPADGGRGALHMLPPNMRLNVQHIQEIWPHSNAVNSFNTQGDIILSTPDYAWLSAGAWFLRTNQVIPGCNLNLFTTTFTETSRCVFGNGQDPGFSDRQQAYNYASQYLLAHSSDDSFGFVIASPSWSLFGLIALSLIFVFA